MQIFIAILTFTGNNFGSYETTVGRLLDVLLQGVWGSKNMDDSDNDGIFDIYDDCPLTLPGSDADHSGCASYQRDRDGDFLADSVDRCPNRPKGEVVDNEGCSDTQRDSDNDGHPDAWDDCPNTPEGEPIVADGCSASQR